MISKLWFFDLLTNRHMNCIKYIWLCTRESYSSLLLIGSLEIIVILRKFWEWQQMVLLWTICDNVTITKIMIPGHLTWVWTNSAWERLQSRFCFVIYVGNEEQSNCECSFMINLQLFIRNVSVPHQYMNWSNFWWFMTGDKK
jgi:hypothetical protein